MYVAAALALGLAAVGALLLANGLHQPGLVLVGSFLVLLGLAVLTDVVVTARQRAGTAWVGPVLAGRRDVLPATVLVEHPVSAWIVGALVAPVGLLLTGWGVLVLVLEADGVGRVVGGALVVATGLGGLWLAVALARRERVEGIWLTSLALTVRDRRGTRRVAWTDIVAVTGPTPPGATVQVWARRPELVVVRPEPRVGDDHRITIETTGYALDADGTARVLRYYTRPGAARELEQPVTLATLRLRAAQEAQTEARPGAWPPPPAPGPLPAARPADPVRAALADIRAAAQDMGAVEGMEFAVDGFPTMLSSEHVDLRRQGRFFEIQYSDMGRSRVIARVAAVEDARRAFLHAVAYLAAGRGHGPLHGVRPTRFETPGLTDQDRVDASVAEMKERQARDDDPDAELHPDGWAQARAVSAAVVAHLGHVGPPEPEARRAATLAALDAHGLPATAHAWVEQLLAEAVDLPANRTTPDLAVLGREVAATMLLRHPGLTDEAARALAHHATYQWR